MESAIERLLWDIILLINRDSALSTIYQTLEGFMHSVYQLVLELQTHVMLPVAYVILSIFILLELQKIATKVESAGGATSLGVELVFKALVKLVICQIVINNVQLLLNGILGVASHLAWTVLHFPTAQNNLHDIVNLFMRYVRDTNFWGRLVILMILFILFLVSIVLRVCIRGTFYLRFFELYVFAAIAPLPVATLPNEEFSSIAKNYFKGFAASGLQGVLIAVVMVIYPGILFHIFGTLGGSIPLMVVALTVYMLVVVMSIGKTKQWAKSLLSIS